MGLFSWLFGDLSLFSSVLLIMAILSFISILIFIAIWAPANPNLITLKQFEYDVEEADRFQKAQKDTRDKFVIIGSGFSGLSIGNALKRAHVPFEIVEAQDNIGGNWYSGVYNHVHILSSKSTTEFKDFPMPEDYPDFPSGKQMFRYLMSYFEHHKLDHQTQLNAKVEKVIPVAKEEIERMRKEEGFKAEELWQVTINGEKRIYKGVIACIGHHWDKRIPEYENMKQYEGLILHSKDYKDPQMFVGKKVLIVGGGNSACDINVESTRYSLETHSSMRRGYWFLPRTIAGIPLIELAKPWMPLWLQRMVMKALLMITIGSYEKYGLPTPDHKIYEQHPTINTEILTCLQLGLIHPHPDIRRFHKRGVEFVDGKVEEIDIVLFATGYKISTPFLGEEILAYENGVPRLVNPGIVPGYRNLFVFGTQQARYGIGPLVTLGANVLPLIISTQEKMKGPMSDVLLKLKIPMMKRNNIQNSKRNDVLADPHEAYLKTQMFKRLLPYFPRVEELFIRFGMIKVQ
eukprot:TRINITY_DN341_c0_g1_i1.p1 TRINITY_DN341_c0_g1~~TRINITY_DN341_c0_g1_i1.p1  ORF type:complete len:517 (-),score=118.52 TRINITY_DN341_c0_g1_i1:69-1619(-)